MTLSEREELIGRILSVLVNGSALPKWMQVAALGRDMRPLAESLADAVEKSSIVRKLESVQALSDLYDSWDGTRPHPGESSPQQREQLHEALER